MKSNTKRTLHYYWSHLKKYKWTFCLSVIAMVLVIALEVTAPYYYKILFDTLNSSVNADSSYPILLNSIIMVAVLHMGSLLFRRIGDMLNVYNNSRVMTAIFADCFYYLQLHSYRFFSNNFTGSLVKKVNRMVFSFETIIDRFYYTLFPLFLTLTFILTILLYSYPKIGLVVLVWSILFLLMNYLFTMYKWKYDVVKSKADSKNTGALADAITNVLNIKLFSALGDERNRFQRSVDEWRHKLVRVWNMEILIEGVQGAIMIGLEFIVFYVALDLWKKGLFSAGDFVLVQTYLIDLFMRLWDFGRNIRQVYSALADSEEMTVILNQPHEVKDGRSAKKLVATQGKIEFKKVSFAYEKNGEVIDDLNLKIKSGEKVALVGESGGGKSTIIKLLLRFFDIQKGQILIDNQNIAKVTQDSLREHISFVPQDPILFHRTLMENIRYGRRGATDEEVLAAAKMAHCHEFILSFSKGYNTFVGERGIKLSGGERQRVAIARAILSNAPILILDEATSSLDSHSEFLIQSALENLMKSKTTIVIAHRLSTIMKMDRILVLSEGGIVEQGSHNELSIKEKGVYKKLWDFQVGGYL